MAKEWIKVGIAFLVLVGVTLYVSLHKKSKFEEAEKNDAQAKQVQLEISQLVRVDVVRGEEVVQFLRRETKDGHYLDRWAPLSDEFVNVPDWWIKKPHETMADRNGIETLLSHLEHLESKKIIDEKGENAKEYDLVSPPVEIHLYTSSSGKPDQVIRVGAKNSAGTGLYLQTSTSPQIVLGGMELDYLKEREFYDWRMKEIFGYKNKFDVESLHVDLKAELKGTSFKAKQTDRHWSLEAPKALPADDAALDAIASVLQGLRAKDFVSEEGSKDAGKFGLDKPLVTLTLNLKGEKASTPRTFMFGQVKDHPDLLVRRSDLPQIFAVEKSTLDEFVKALPELVTKRPYKIETGDVSSFRVTTQTGMTELTKTEGIWKLSQPVSDLAVADEVDKLLRKVVGFKGKDYSPWTGSPKGEPYLKVELTTEKGPFVADLREVQPKEDLWLYAENPARAYRIAKEAVATVFDTLERVREKRWTTHKRNDLASVQVRHGDRTFHFRPTDDDSWVIEKMEKVPDETAGKLRETDQVKGLVESLRNLKLDTFDSIESQSKKTAAWSVEFRPKEGEAVQWEVGAPEGERTPVWSKTRNVGGWMKSGDLKDVEALLGIQKVEKK